MTYQFPDCTDIKCPEYGRSLVPGLDATDAPIWHCLSCPHTQPRQPRTALSKRDKAGNRYIAREQAEALEEKGGQSCG